MKNQTEKTTDITPLNYPQPDLPITQEQRIFRAQYLMAELQRTKINQIVILKQLMDEELHRDLGYESITELAKDVLKINQKTAARYTLIASTFNTAQIGLLADAGTTQLYNAIANAETIEVESVSDEDYVIINGERRPLTDFAEDLKAAVAAEESEKRKAIENEKKKIAKEKEKEQKSFLRQELELQHTIDELGTENKKLRAALETISKEKAIDPEKLKQIGTKKEAHDTIAQAFARINEQLDQLSSLPVDIVTGDIASQLSYTFTAIQSGVKSLISQYTGHIFLDTNTEG